MQKKPPQFYFFRPLFAGSIKPNNVLLEDRATDRVTRGLVGLIGVVSTTGADAALDDGDDWSRDVVRLSGTESGLEASSLGGVGFSALRGIRGVDGLRATIVADIDVSSSRTVWSKNDDAWNIDVSGDVLPEKFADPAGDVRSGDATGRRAGVE